MIVFYLASQNTRDEDGEWSGEVFALSNVDYVRMWRALQVQLRCFILLILSASEYA